MTFGERKSGQWGNNFIKLISNRANPVMTWKKRNCIHLPGLRNSTQEYKLSVFIFHKDKGIFYKPAENFRINVT